MPVEAFFVDVSSRVPGPETVNVTAFVAVVTVALESLHTLPVIRDVAAPSAVMLVGSAVLMSFEASGYRCSADHALAASPESIVRTLQ